MFVPICLAPCWPCDVCMVVFFGCNSCVVAFVLIYFYRMDLQYRYIYFNAMNFAVKSPLLGKRAGYSAIPSELMRILVQIDKDHQQ